MSAQHRTGRAAGAVARRIVLIHPRECELTRLLREARRLAHEYACDLAEAEREIADLRLRLRQSEDAA